MILLYALAIIFLLAGSYLLSRGTMVWDGGLFVVFSLIILAIAFARDELRKGRGTAWLRSLFPVGRAARLVAWLQACAVVFSLGVALLARTQPAGADFSVLFITWALAVVVFVISLFIPTAPGARPLQARLSFLRERAATVVRTPGFWALGLLLLLGGLLRGLGLEQAPANLGGDEGTQLLLGLRLVGYQGTRQGMGNPFATGWYSVPTMSFAAYGLTMRVFGATIAGGRALSALAGTLTVLTTYAFARVIGGRRTAWVAGAIMAVSSYHIHYSRLASNQIFDPLIGTVALAFLWLALQSPGTGPEQTRGRQTGVAAAWGLAGATAGLGWYAYFGARWVSFLIAATVGLWYLFDPTLLRRHWRGLLLFGVGWLVVALPLLGWYTVNPSASSERYEAVSIFASGWLTREVEITGKSALQLLLQQTWRAATAFHLTPDPTFWYRPGRPLVDFVTGALLLLGMVDALVRVRWPSRRLLLLWFWSTLAMAWIMTENPPSSQRGLLLAPAVAIFASWGLQRVAPLLRLDGKRFVYLAATVLVVIAVLNVGFYFGAYVPRRVYGNPTAEIATAVGHHMLANPEPICPPDPDLPCPGYVYMLGPPQIYWDFGTLAFMLRRFPGTSVPEDANLEGAPGPARFVVVPHRLAEMETIRELYPGGTETPLYSPNDYLLAVLYDWSPGAAH